MNIQYFVRLLAFMLRENGFTFEILDPLIFHNLFIFKMAHGSNVIVSNEWVCSNSMAKYYLTFEGNDIKWENKNICRMPFDRVDELIVNMKRDLRNAKTIKL